MTFGASSGRGASALVTGCSIVVSLALACGPQALTQAPSLPAAAAAGWVVDFAYTRSVGGQASGNGVTVQEDHFESYQGQMRCARGVTLTAPAQFQCSGTAQARYALSSSCKDRGGTNSLSEEADPWSGPVQAVLNFEIQEGNGSTWSMDIEAPPMQLHKLQVDASGKRTVTDSRAQVITDLVALGSLRADGRSGTWFETGEEVGELIFGDCKTGVRAEKEKAEVRVDIKQTVP